jgi:hypothetical protein
MTKPRHTEEHVATPEADGVGVLCRGDRATTDTIVQ